MNNVKIADTNVCDICGKEDNELCVLETTLPRLHESKIWNKDKTVLHGLFYNVEFNKSNVCQTCLKKLAVALPTIKDD